MSFTIQWWSPEFHFMGKYNEDFRIGEHRRCIWGRLIVVFSEVSLALSKSKWRDYSNLFQRQWRPMEWIFPFLSWSQRRKKNFISRHDNLTVIVLWVKITWHGYLSQTRWYQHLDSWCWSGRAALHPGSSSYLNCPAVYQCRPAHWGGSTSSNILNNKQWVLL